jgi:ATP-binding cassette subfamily F protein uup
MALIGINSASVAYTTNKPILLGVSLQIERGERIAIVGRNGAGKSTLMKAILGDVIPDEGDVTRQKDTIVAYLPQDVPLKMTGRVADIVATGVQMPEGGIAESFEQLVGWREQQAAQEAMSRTGVEPNMEISTASAGMKRRVLLARALASKPDVLMLDEPTNHLDIDSITWLEHFLLRFDGAVLFVTHDRAFLQRVATRIVEIDRARLTAYDCTWDEYIDRRDARIANEEAAQAQFDKKLAQEEAWVRKGVKARTARNEGRVRALQKMRKERAGRRDRVGKVRLNVKEGEESGNLVVDIKGVSVTVGERKIIDNLTTVIMRGDRVGIIGPNGSGKTTLLRTLLGELTPTAGEVKLGTRLEIAYFDQLHAKLDESKSVAENITPAGDTVEVYGRRMHIIGYLKQFLFQPDRVRSPVSSLSGGERNRLLLAKLFTKPTNMLVLDEPTNDLDLETLDVLEEMLADYTGTILLVSHDRALINNVVTSTLALEGNGFIRDYAGGYDDWLRQRKQTADTVKAEAKLDAAQVAAPSGPAKLNYRQKQELEALPAKIADLEAEQAALSAKMSDAAFYKKGGGEVAAATARSTELLEEIAAAYERWGELESLA